MLVVTIPIVFFSRPTAYCWMGTRLETKIEDLPEALYQSDWYEMNGKERKYLQLIIMMTQNMEGFNGIFVDVNLDTFQSVKCHFELNYEIEFPNNILGLFKG